MTRGPRDAAAAGPATPGRRSVAVRLTLAACAALVFCTFAALGTWQVSRLFWKLDLIERVDQRVHAAAVPAPLPASWPQLRADSDEYSHVRLAGTFLPELTTRVQASTELGSGYWLLTPLCSADGSVVLVNRGFVAGEAGEPIAPPARATGRNPCAAVLRSGHTAVELTGLLRMSEPGGGFLRQNDAAANRWYSRHVQAIAAARGLARVAPYFVDADAGQDTSAGTPERPVGGLTVVSFHNSHLVYAITWYALALMVAGACVWVVRDERRRPGTGPDHHEGIDGKQDQH